MSAPHLVARAGLAASLLTLGCSSESAPAAAGLMLSIDTDLAPGKDFDRLEIEVQPPAGLPTYTKIFSEFGQPGLPLSFPATLAIVNHGRGDESVTLRISIGQAGKDVSPVGKPVGLREVVTTIPSDRVALLRVHLEWLCEGTAGAKPDYVEGLCPEGQTCLGGSCEDWSVDANSLPTYDERAVFGGGSPRGDGDCFDTSRCFASGTAAQPDSACSIPAPVDDVNVALVVPDGAGGICSGGVCLVLLEEGLFGVDRSGDRLTLPRAACDAIKAKRALGIVTTTACPAKPPSLPTCGPWSAIKRTATTDAPAPPGFPPRDAGAG